MPLLLIQPSDIVKVHEKLTLPAHALPSVHAAILASTLARLARTEAFPRHMHRRPTCASRPPTSPACSAPARTPTPRGAAAAAASQRRYRGVGATTACQPLLAVVRQRTGPPARRAGTPPSARGACSATTAPAPRAPAPPSPCARATARAERPRGRTPAPAPSGHCTASEMSLWGPREGAGRGVTARARPWTIARPRLRMTGACART